MSMKKILKKGLCISSIPEKSYMAVFSKGKQCFRKRGKILVMALP
jgi:hypothetical protein